MSVSAPRRTDRLSRVQEAMVALQDRLWRMWMVVSPTLALSVMRPWEQLFATLLLASITTVATVTAAKVTAYSANSLHSLAATAANAVVHISHIQPHTNLSKSFQNDAAPWVDLQSWS